MAEEVKQLEDLIQNAQSILITSHISPDPDAVSSVLLLGKTLKFNYPDKAITMVLEEEPAGLEFLGGYKEIDFGPIFQSLESSKPDLFILLDGNNYERCSRHDGEVIRNYIRQYSVNVIIVDHHEQDGKDDADVYINNMSASTVQEVYAICFRSMGLKQPKSAPQTAMTGFYADTGGFVYVKSGQQDAVFGFAKDLVDAGADIEAAKYDLDSYAESDMMVIGRLASNTSHSDGYTYSFLEDEFMDDWLKNHQQAELQRPTNTFLNEYIRNIDGRKWGFIVYKNPLQGEHYYSASFRSKGGHPDVAAIASKLGGGGHKPAAGAKFEAGSLNDAINKVKSTISGP